MSIKEWGMNECSLLYFTSVTGGYQKMCIKLRIDIGQHPQKKVINITGTGGQEGSEIQHWQMA